MPLPELIKIVRKNIAKQQKNVLPNGIICLKGGSLADELKPFSNIVQVTEISNWFTEEWFQTKQVVYLPL